MKNVVNKYVTITVCIFLVTFFFSSCAILLNKPHQDIHILCDSTLKLTKVENSSKHYPDLNYFNPLKADSIPTYEVSRSKKTLVLHFQLKDSTKITYHLKSGLSPTYYLGNIFFNYGYIIDLFSPKIFRYSPNNYFRYDTAKQKIIRSNFLPEDKRGINFNLGWSFLNAYDASLFNNFNGYGSPLGLNLQVEYFHKKNQSLLFETGVATMIVPRSPHRYRSFKYFEDKDSLVNNYAKNYWFALSYKYNINKLSFGAGISFSPLQNTNRKFYISHRDTVLQGDTNKVKFTLISDPIFKIQNLQKIGVIFNVAYTFNKTISAGMNWHLFIKDINVGTGIYSSHFFNFYIAFKAYRLNLSKSKPKYDYY